MDGKITLHFCCFIKGLLINSNCIKQRWANCGSPTFVCGFSSYNNNNNEIEQCTILIHS